MTVAGLKSDTPVICSRKVIITPDTSLEKIKDQEFDIVLLPGGGPGAEKFAAVSLIINIVFRSFFLWQFYHLYMN